MKKYRLYLHTLGHFDRRECVLVGDDYDWIKNNMIDKTRELCIGYFKSAVIPVLNYIIIEVCNDGYEKSLENGYIMPSACLE